MAGVKAHPDAILPPSPTTFARRLEYLMYRDGTRRSDLAEAAEINRHMISKYTNGQYSPGLAVAARIADYYGVSLDWLAGLSDKEERS